VDKIFLGTFPEKDAFGKIAFNFSQHGLLHYAIIAKNFVIYNGSPGRLAKFCNEVENYFGIWKLYFDCSITAV